MNSALHVKAQDQDHPDLEGTMDTSGGLVSTHLLHNNGPEQI